MTAEPRSPPRLLRTGTPTAHPVNCLMLLGSPPDMVHSPELRKTHPSTQPTTAQTSRATPSKTEITPAIADFRYKAPLPPRPVWPCPTHRVRHIIIVTDFSPFCKRKAKNPFLFSNDNATVYGKHLPRDKICAFRGQKGSGGGHVCHPADAAKRGFINEGGAVLLC